MEKPAVIFDNGSGYSKLGYSGNMEPSFIIPTTIASRDSLGVPVSRLQCDDLDFFMGEEAFLKQKTHKLTFPVKEGQIINWDDIERFWQRSIYSWLRVEPQEHVFMLTEPPLNPSENREQMAEIMFETFDVKGLHIGVQPVLSLFGSNEFKENKVLTGLVVDSGEGVTSLIPVAHGYVIPNCIRHLPIAGRDITRYIAQTLKDRREQIAIEDLTEVSRTIKENHCYVCKDMDRELKKYSDPNSELNVTFSDTGRATGAPINVKVGPERFLGPEVFFSPGSFTKDWDKPLDQVIDSAIQACPIDVRRDLYSNVVLSGGTTMLKNFHRRLQDRLQKLVTDRLESYRANTGHSPIPINCNIKSYKTQKYAAWFGASMFAQIPEFQNVYHTREKYQEYGPSIARTNIIFSDILGN